MILFWKSGPLGRLWIDESILKEQVDSCLPEGMACSSVQLFGDRDLLNVYVSFSPEKGTPDTENLRAVLSGKLSCLGLKTTVSLVAAEGDTAAENNNHPLLKSPVFWGLALGMLVAVINLGLSGLFWVLFFGFGAYGIAWLFLTPAGRNRLASFLDSFEE
ncbi:MAG: hypothetical protein ACC613_07165 [Synergistales bacterium]|jgi:hypothetical protein